MKMLVVEDEEELLSSICTYLREEGYRCEPAMTFTEASQKIILERQPAGLKGEEGRSFGAGNAPVR